MTQIAANMIQPIGATFQEGIPLDELLLIPDNYFAVIARHGLPTYALPCGRHAIHPAYYPEFRVKRGVGTVSREALDAACYTIRADPVLFSWNTRLLLDGKRPQPLTYIGIQGFVAARVVDPLRFYHAVCQGLIAESAARQEHKSFQLTLSSNDSWSITPYNLLTAGDRFCANLAENAVQEAIQRLNLPSEQVQGSLQVIQTAAEERIAQHLIDAGMTLHEFQIESIGGPHPVECQHCGTLSSPTASAAFCYNVSLLVVRYTATKTGACCLSCALKYGLGYTALTLACGWWGLIGLVLTPFIIIINLYNLIRVLIRARPARVASS